MNQKIKVYIVGTIVIAIVIAIGAFSIKGMFKANDEVMSLDEYYKGVVGKEISNDKAVFIMDNEIKEEVLDIVEGEVYIDYELAYSFNQRFYWDELEKIFVFTMPNDMIEVKPNETSYKFNDEIKESDRPIVIESGDNIKVLLSFVDENSEIISKVYTNPNRVVITSVWDEKLVADVKEDTQLRVGGSSKDKILTELKKGQKLTYIMEDNVEIQKGYIRVATEDGIVGFVKQSCMEESNYVTDENDYQEPTYTSVVRDHKINLTWNMVTNMDGNYMMEDLLDSTQGGVNVICPTWFSIADEEGGITSLASKDYVDRAHAKGIEVWGLIDDFTPDVKIKEILSHTSSRRQLIANIVDAIDEYDMDGINIDFEYVREGFAKSYIQFIRELSIECRERQKVLSIDSGMPMYSKYYDRKEQGIVADYVVIMAYDEYSTVSKVSGSVASISWTKEAIKETKELVADEKILIGIPFYDRLFEEDSAVDMDEPVVAHKDLTMRSTVDLIEEKGVTPKWDDEAKQNYIEYNEGGHVFKLWIEDAKSIEEKMKVIEQAGVAGVASWRLGQETSDVWPVINSYIK